MKKLNFSSFKLSWFGFNGVYEWNISQYSADKIVTIITIPCKNVILKITGFTLFNTVLLLHILFVTYFTSGIFSMLTSICMGPYWTTELKA